MLRSLFISAKDFSEVEGIKDDTNKRIPNLLILGYLLHVLEDRLIPTEDEGHN